MLSYIPKPALLILCLAILVAACSDDAGPPPAPTSTPVPLSVVEAVDTAAPGPTDAAAPTATAILAPTATIGLPQTSTPIPTSTTPPQVDVVLRTGADFGDGRNPLTGEEVADPAQLNRRPLAVKISNAPARWVRPQSGLNDADLIFEHITEAGITRFTIIVYGRTPSDVGPIRSARLIDLELPAMYDAALVYSGSSEGVRQRLLAIDFRPRILMTNEPGYYRTGADKPFEHTLYGKPETFWEVLATKGLNAPPAFTTNVAFSSAPPAGGSPASEVAIDYNATLVQWKYDPDSGRYDRWADGEEHRDGNTDEQVNVANVVVVFANHVEDPNICEQVTNGVCTHLSIEAQIWGTGPATVFRDGQRYDGTWQRIGRSDMLTFHNAAGEPLPLQIGNSWFQVIPTWYADPVSVTP